jgi:hypothetical protein
MVNSRGDTMSAVDWGSLTKDPASLSPAERHMGMDKGKFISDPAKRSEMLMNWLTAGGKPKLPDISKIFAEKEAGAPVETKAAAGQGINSLFGFGNLIGEIQPLKPMIEPLNQSPMQKGVPYAAPPLSLMGPK